MKMITGELDDSRYVRGNTMEEQASNETVLPLPPADLFSLNGRKALITGGSGGIGRVLAMSLARAGADVCVHGRNAARLKQTVEALKSTGVHVVSVEGDLSQVSVCSMLVKEADRRLGGLDVLVNCAGTNRRKPIANVTEEDFEYVMAVNLKSVYFLSREAHRVMRQRGGGKIIHIGSINSHYGLDTVSVYGASKGGIAQLTKVMAVEWARDNVQVNCLTPGFMLTPLSIQLWSRTETASWFQRRIPQRRPGRPDELVGALLLLASQASSYITGQDIIVDGGFLAGGSWVRDEGALDDAPPT